MSAAKSSFTPGPWEVISTDKEAYDGAHVADMSNNLLVIAEAEVGCPVADARLIAAAPSLLEACRRAVCVLSTTDYADEYEIVSAAIAKATGGAA